jgi:hypothetical protein
VSDDATVSSGNVFADAGLPDADTHLVKAGLVSRSDEIIRERGLSQREAASPGSPGPTSAASSRDGFAGARSSTC